MKAEGALAATVREALRIRDAMRADGVPEGECREALRRSIRSAWPFTREWKFLCGECRDYGLVMHHCPGDATCGRTRDHLPHEFGTPCWCGAGARYRPPKPSEPDVSEAGSQRRKPQRLGR